MAEKKQNLVEEALLQMKNLEEAVTENAKGILASTMKEEISELVKESLSEEDVEEVEMEESAAEKMEGEKKEKGMYKEMDYEMKEQEELDMMDVEDEVEDEMEDEMEDMEDMDDMEDEMDSDEMLMMDLPGGDLEVDDEEEILLPLDLTGASDEEILKVFKAMGEEDGIVVTQDGDEIHLKDEEANVEYQIQTEGYEEEEDVIVDEEEDEYTEGYEMEEEDDEVVYEIELGDEDEEEEMEMEEGQGYDDREDESLGMRRGKIADKDLNSEKARRDDAHFETREGEKMEGYKEESKEQRSNANLRKAPNARKVSEPTKRYASDRMRPAQRNEALEKEVAQLREKNEEYRKALNIFKEKLNEVAVFNSNLAYATRLFTEHSTTKQEKINILRRFDSAETIKESKSLYKTIKEDLGSKENSSVVTESVSTKVQKSPSKGSATNLIESKTYENPQFLRMKDLMNKIQK